MQRITRRTQQYNRLTCLLPLKRTTVNLAPTLHCENDPMVCVSHIPDTHRGIALFVRSSHRVLYVQAFANISWAQIIACVVNMHNTNVLILVVYKKVALPPTTLPSLMNSLSCIIHSCTAQHAHDLICVMGDMNIHNTRAANTQHSAMQLACEPHGLHDILPLHHTTMHKTTIDYMLCSQVQQITQRGIYPCEISDHHMLYAFHDMHRCQRART